MPDESVSLSRLEPLLQLTLVSTFLGVRLALLRLRQVLEEQGICDYDAGTVEIILAEVLNNIVEHAYSCRGDRSVHVDVVADDGRLRFAVTDDGQPLPGGLLPQEELAPNPVGNDTLPEGGFGRFLIRDLAKDLTYSRCEGRNLLSFAVDLAPADAT